MIGYEITEKLEYLHKIGYIYRDIKPENIVIGNFSEYSNLFLIDFGLAKRYKNLKNIHIKELMKKKLIGFIHISFTSDVKNPKVCEH